MAALCSSYIKAMEEHWTSLSPSKAKTTVQKIREMEAFALGMSREFAERFTVVSSITLPA